MKRFVFLTSETGRQIAVDPEFVISVFPIQEMELVPSKNTATVVKIFDGSKGGCEFTVCEGVKEVVKALEGGK